MAGGREYSCETASQTLEWIHAIIDFLKRYRFFLDAHVVNFFKDKLWETVDKEWIDCLRSEPVENLLLIPSGVVQDPWPASLKNFILTSKLLAIPGEQADLQKVLPDLRLCPLNNVLTQGMNQKKKHEVEALAAVVSSTAKSAGARTIIDVGAGQGYLAQVLSFHYQLSVIAIDASSHHGKVTEARAERIRKHYAAKMRKSRLEGGQLSMPKTVTCRILSTDMLRALSNSLQQKDEVQHLNLIAQASLQHPYEHSEGIVHSSSSSSSSCPLTSIEGGRFPLLLAGLHACGDLSVTMLRSFLECNEVKAVVSIGCCYNLLSEGGAESLDTGCGFPMSNGVKVTGLFLGKNSRDLACQSAERWRGLGNDAGLHNFELHAFRAAFQMVLSQYHPETLISCPAIGRQGKALRRQRNRRIIESHLQHENTSSPISMTGRIINEKENGFILKPAEAERKKHERNNGMDTSDCVVESCDAVDYVGMAQGTDGLFHGLSPNQRPISEEATSVDKYSLFEKFSLSGLDRLGFPYSKDIDLPGIWRQTEPFSELIGPYWSLRAALGPVLETIILLDRLLFLQEHGTTLEAILLPIFDPALSPRNVAIIAKKI